MDSKPTGVTEEEETLGPKTGRLNILSQKKHPKLILNEQANFRTQTQRVAD
jgi:hypothetical protein